MIARMDAQKIHLAERPPVACASCNGQYPDRQHVDFGAGYDGPVLNEAEVIANGTMNMQIDELIICDECLRAAAALLGLAEPGEMRGLLEDMQERNTELTERLNGAIAALDAKEKADKTRETVLESIKPKAQRRPRQSKEA